MSVLTGVELLLQLLDALLILRQLLPVAPAEVGHLVALGVLQGGHLVLVLVHLPAHLLPQVLGGGRTCTDTQTHRHTDTQTHNCVKSQTEGLCVFTHQNAVTQMTDDTDDRNTKMFYALNSHLDGSLELKAVPMVAISRPS